MNLRITFSVCSCTNFSVPVRNPSGSRSTNRITGRCLRSRPSLILMVLTIWMVAMEKKGGSRVLGALLATASVIAFILTENVHNPMILVDKWTILTAVIAVAQLVVLLFRGKKAQEAEEAEVNAEEFPNGF